MNGEVNGTMEEPMETSLPSSPNNIHNKKPVSENCEFDTNHCENSNNVENSNHLDSESSHGPMANSGAECSGNDNSNDSEDHHPMESTNEQACTKEAVQENCNTMPLENHYSNSNDSYAESMTSSQAKSETNEQQAIQCVDEKSKDADSLKAFGVNANANDEDSDEVDSEEDSSDDGSEASVEPRAEDTVSINSDTEPEGEDETSQESQSKNKNDSNDVIILENESRPDSQNGTVRDSPSPEIHEITSDNDDCIVTHEEKITSSVNENKTQLRRSSRAIKRKRYNHDDMENGDESDVEEVMMEDPLTRKSKPIVINDTKALVEMAAKKMKSNQSNNQSSEPTVVIIDTNSITSGKTSLSMQQGKHSTSMNSIVNPQTLYQSIVARGTTVTPVTNKINTPTQSSPQPPQPSILPSLTDDMFVVEAPSFIVPYVYEKPSIKPFREFVDELSKELEEVKLKEEQEKLIKEQEEKEQKDQERKEKKERGEQVEDSEEEKEKTIKAEEEDDNEEKKKKKAERKEQRRRRNEDDDASWDGESSTYTDDDILSEDEEKTVVIKDKVDAIEEIKNITDLTVDKISSGKSDNYFDCYLGKFFIDIGLNLVQEYVQGDLLKQQNRKLHREKKSGHSTKATESSIASLMKNLEFSKENNAPYTFPQKKCEFCSFKTESILSMAHHLETPHMKNNVYKCNYCTYEIRSPHDILYHMEAEHNVRGKLERAPAYHQCPNCPFEDNGKGKLARHMIPCAKKFKPEMNLAPPIEWEPPAKIPKITRSRNSMMSSYQSAFNRSLANSGGRPTMGIASMIPGMSSGYRARGRSPQAVPPRAAPVHGTPIVRGGLMIRHNAPSPVLLPSNYPVANNTKSNPAHKPHQPSISITPLPRHPQPVQTPPSQQTKSTFVICEICDGYIKDLEQLRNHMQWIHKVKIHPKMIYNRPPLNCQKCQFRFFTDQGLERHLLGSHGLVTSSMQEAANKGKDAGRCPVCGRVYQWKLLNHVAKDHNLTLKPAHLSYKCTVCTSTFGMYKQFENHVYSAHSVVAKRVMDKSKTNTPPAKTNSDSLLKPLKINDEITIIPQPVKPTNSKLEEK